MNKRNFRKEYLLLISKLYDLASQFDAEVLFEIREIADKERNRAVNLSIAGLLELVSDHDVPKERSSRGDSASLAVSPDHNESGLITFFSSKEVFESTADIISVLPFSFSLRPKESRERFVKRLVDFLGGLSSEDRRAVMGHVQSALSKRLGSNFVSNWSKLIRGL